MSNNNNANRVNGTQACAACKYQRRKCVPDCTLAPYFPHDRQRQFLNAHKLFGVSNITKIIRNLDPPEKDEAMKTIIFQSDVRAADPVGGCYRIILELQRQIDYGRAELVVVLQQLAICRAQAEAIVLGHHQSKPEPGISSSTLNCDGVINHYEPVGGYNPMIGHDQDFREGHEEEYFLHVNNQAMPLQEFASWAIQDTASSGLYEKQSFVDECDGVIEPTFLDIGGERLELQFDHEEETVEKSDDAISKEDKFIQIDEIAPSISSKDGNKAMLKEDHMASQFEESEDHDLKNAATFFTLTNCNS